MSEFTESEYCVAALFVNDARDNQEVTSWLQANRRAVRQLLWGSNPSREHSGQGGHLRIPTHTPVGQRGKKAWEEVYDERRAKANSITFDEIQRVYPQAYLSPPWRGFTHTSSAFRDWHVVTHSPEAADAMHDRITKLYNQGEVEWAYMVEARGSQKHWHCLVSLTYPTTSLSLSDTLGLTPSPDSSSEEGDKLAPIWGSFKSARRYLERQATQEGELGVEPNRRIWVDGNSASIALRVDQLRAVAQGENTEVYNRDYSKSTRSPEENKALQSWITYKQQIKNRARENPEGNPEDQDDEVPHREPNAQSVQQTHQQVQTRQEAELKAQKASEKYTNRVYTINYKEKLAHTVFVRPPLDWFGEEVVCLLNLPAQSAREQLEAPWLKAVAKVFYTLA